ANEGYHFCTYIPFGDEWYGYFMRRLAERPQNINLVLKDKLYDENNQIKKKPLIIAGTAVAALSTAVLLCRRKNYTIKIFVYWYTRDLFLFIKLYIVNWS